MENYVIIYKNKGEKTNTSNGGSTGGDDNPPAENHPSESIISKIIGNTTANRDSSMDYNL